MIESKNALDKSEELLLNSFDEITAILTAIGHPNRFKILVLLLKGPLTFQALLKAMNYAVVNKNIFGSDVDVEGNPEEAILDVKRCSNLEAALQFAEKSMPMTKQQHCSGCINGYFKQVAANLGFTLDVAFGDNGCKMTISK